jgi:hypothetical protein
MTARSRQQVRILPAETRRLINGRPEDPGVTARVLQLEGMSLEELRRAWRSWLGSEPPGMKAASFVRRLLAWKLQERAYGGHSAAVLRRLKQLYEAFEKDPNYNPIRAPGLHPGTTLVREWNGVTHRVQVMEAGFAWQGKSYDSLSEIAREITGTRWSGPKFFGLKPPKGKA